MSTKFDVLNTNRFDDNALKASVVSFGLPFCFLMLLMSYALYKALREEPRAA